MRILDNAGKMIRGTVKKMKMVAILILTAMALGLSGADTSVIVWPRYVPDETKQECFHDLKLDAKMGAIDELRKREAMSIKPAKYSQEQSVSFSTNFNRTAPTVTSLRK